MMEIVAVDRVEAVYRLIHDRLWRSLLSYCGDRDVASDAESEAFAQVVRRGDDVDDVERWVWKAAFRIAAGMLSKRRRWDRAVLTDVGAVELPPATVDFLALLGGLSVQQRACIVLRYVGQFKPAEIADVLDTSSGTVRVQLHRAHEVLRESLKADRRGVGT